MKVTQKLITPMLAQKLLAGNTGNRPLNRLHVLRLAADMRAGRWKENGDTIRRAGDRLIDGQHRLSAVVESGCSVSALLVEVEDDVFTTIDQNRRRSAGDTLAVLGESNVQRLAAALCLVDRYLTGRMLVRVQYTNAEVSGLLERYPAVRESVRVAHNPRRLMHHSSFAALHYIFANLDSGAATDFVDFIGATLRLGVEDPFYVLREQLVRNLTSPAKLRQEHLMGMSIKAWNARRKGESIERVNFPGSGRYKPEFPVAV